LSLDTGQKVIRPVVKNTIETVNPHPGSCVLKLHVGIMNYVYLNVVSRVFVSAQTSYFTLAGMSNCINVKKENMHLVQKYAIKRGKMKKCFKISYPCNF